MARYGNVTILPADPNPWASAFSLIGSIMGKNAANRQDAKDTDAFVSSITPNNTGLLTNPTIKAPNATATTGGLLQGNLKDNVTQSLAPNTSFLDNAGVMQQQTQPIQQVQPQTWNDIQNQYNTAWGTKAKATLAKMSPEARKQYLPQIMQMREQELATLKADWTKKESANNWDLFNNETDPAKKVALANKLGLPIESVKFSLQPNTTTQLVDLGDRKIQVGVNRFDGKMINMETGEPISQADLVKGMTPGEQATASYRANYGGSRSSGGSGGDTQKMSMYKWAAGYELQPTGETDYMGKPVMTRVQRNPELAKQLYGELFSDGENPNGGGASVDYNEAISKVTAAIGQGISKDKIIEAVREDYGDMADVILADSGLLGGEEQTTSEPWTMPTFGSNGESLKDYLGNGTFLDDWREKNRNLGKG